jgi:hypothetical protein
MIVDGPIRGSWWAHPKHHQIWSIFKQVTASRDILMCRLIKEKRTFVHRRLWPAMVRAKKHFSLAQLAQAGDEHTAAGYHVRRDVPFPKWVPADVLVEAQGLSEREALLALAQAGVRPSRTAKPVQTPAGRRRRQPYLDPAQPRSP